MYFDGPEVPDRLVRANVVVQLEEDRDLVHEGCVPNVL